MISVARIIIRFILRLLFRAELRGYVKPVGKTLIVSNHQSFIDGLLLGAFLPFAPTYLVHSQIASKWNFKILLSFIDYLVIDSTSPLAMKSVIGLLESGVPVVIFPEGRITVTGSRMKVYDGPAFADECLQAVHEAEPRPATPRQGAPLPGARSAGPMQLGRPGGLRR